MRFPQSAQGLLVCAHKGITRNDVLVIIAIIAILIGLLIPGIQGARGPSYRMQCSNNLHNVGIAYHVFLDNHGNKTSDFVGDRDWVFLLLPYFDAQEQLLICPSDDQQSAQPGSGKKSEELSSSFSYGVNNAAHFLGLTGDSQKVLVVEYKRLVAKQVSMAGVILDPWESSCAPRHGGAMNVLFRDGSVQEMQPFTELDPRIQQIYQEFWVPQSLLQ
jgi:prepilin-type processing-associated H-X9-DG protein